MYLIPARRHVRDKDGSPVARLSCRYELFSSPYVPMLEDNQGFLDHPGYLALRSEVVPFLELVEQ